MQQTDPMMCTPNLEDAINYHPLVVSPEMALVDVIAHLSQAPFSHCTLGDLASETSTPEAVMARPTCALIMQDDEIVGILTERDIVRFAAAGMDCEHVTAADVMAHPVKTLPLADFKDIFAVMFLFRRYKIRHLPIVDDQNQLVGVAEPSSLRKVLKPANLLKLRRVSEVMSTSVIHAPPTCPVLNLAQLMAEHRVSCVVIVEPAADNGLKPIGIVTERDIVQFQAMQFDIGKITAAEVMSSPLFLLDPGDSLWAAHQQMQQLRVRRLVVSWNWGQDLGIVTQTSLLKVFDPLEMYGIIETLQQTIQQLEAERATYWRQQNAEVC
ncbi:CBS domain-containing protein [Acaryochloris sp. IP29b_bin.148]|uniref:CBS domain-containing protein n=1 Tax=Acaryochloris sp. IP29b_bin.148 TaxID=2969218 RepID=UPI0026195C59|nr:CBS domain-containing protein [Acaryochloris sp. IP29b_bin.148]